MPPKKKKSGKGKGKGKKSGKKSARTAPATEQLSELTKEFYLIQIKDLENRLARYQKKCDELELTSHTYKADKEKTESNMKNIMDYLQNEIHKKDDAILDLKDRLIGTQQAKDTEKETYEMKLQQLRNEFQNMKDQLTSENMILHGKLAALEEFKVQKEELMKKMMELGDNLKQQEKEHQDEIYKLERKQVVDKDRLKKEMVTRVNQVAAEFRKVSNKQMAETTKRTIRENVSINAQLAKMSDKTVELIHDNDDMRTKDKDTKQKLDLLETNEKELAKKNHSNQKIIRMLTEKCKNQEAIIADYEMREEQYQEIEREVDLLRQQTETARDEIQGLAKENENFQDQLTAASKQHAEGQDERRKLEKVLANAAIALRQALKTTTTEDVEESPFDIAEKRNNMLENMLVLLNSAAAIGLGPTPKEFAMAGEPPRPRSSSQMPGTGQGIRPGELPQSPLARSVRGTLPHYQLGDLGLIPRPQHQIPTSLEKTKDLPEANRLGTLKRVLTKSIATQTISSPKAMFYADQLLSKIPTHAKLLHDLHASDKGQGQGHGGLKITSKVF